MSQRKTENFILLIISLACIGLTLESVLMGWEFWVPPLLVIGALFLWSMNFLEKPSLEIRKVLDLLFSVLAVFFYGVHETSFFDISIILVLCLVAFSFFDEMYMINILLGEYAVLISLQIVLANISGATVFDMLNISRILLHVIVVVLIYLSCSKVISDRVEVAVSEKEKEEQIRTNNADMEDFLTNISHELRTPVNVVNGMSDLLIKRNAGKEAFSIKDAGIRLAYQIEDIQDYTECKRGNLLLEEEDYMSTSLINDVVTSFRLLENSNDLELVVDLAPSVPTRMRGDIRKLHKIFRHLLANAVKFTKKGGIFVRMYAEKLGYGVNLCIEMTDTGIGMDRKALESLAEGMYQANKKRNRSSGGIGLGLYIVYGFTHRCGGFVKIESEKNMGTTVRVTIPQRVSDPAPCLGLSEKFYGNILFHVKSDKYSVPRVRDFYRSMAANLATGIRVPLYSAETIKDIDRLREKMNVTHIFMGEEEYEENPDYFDTLSKNDIVITVSANAGFSAKPGSQVVVMPKPLYAYPVIKLINEGKNAENLDLSAHAVKPMFSGIRALIVDDEPMNLVVASSLFSDYKMIIETAGSGKEAITKFRDGDYHIIFMDHMMPEMDGVEAMKLIKQAAAESGREILVVALTANVVSGAREMFVREGFDGFIAKPINTSDFERVMLQLFPQKNPEKGGART